MSWMVWSPTEVSSGSSTVMVIAPSSPAVSLPMAVPCE